MRYIAKVRFQYNFLRVLWYSVKILEILSGTWPKTGP